MSRVLCGLSGAICVGGAMADIYLLLARVCRSRLRGCVLCLLVTWWWGPSFAWVCRTDGVCVRTRLPVALVTGWA